MQNLREKQPVRGRRGAHDAEHDRRGDGSQQNWHFRDSCEGRTFSGRTQACEATKDSLQRWGWGHWFVSVKDQQIVSLCLCIAGSIWTLCRWRNAIPTDALLFSVVKESFFGIVIVHLRKRIANQAILIPCFEGRQMKLNGAFEGESIGRGVSRSHFGD